jgi:hypothetical protein
LLFGTPREAEAPAARFPLLLRAVVVTTLAAAGIFYAVKHPLEPDPQITPAAAVAAIERAKVGPVFNEYGFGGYLIYAGVPPFIDGRTELYGGDFTARHHRAVTLADLPEFLRLLDQYKIGATLLPPWRPAVALLDRMPGWERLYADPIAVVHVRKQGPERP